MRIFYVPSIAKIIDYTGNMRAATNCSKAHRAVTAPINVKMNLWIVPDEDIISSLRFMTRAEAISNNILTGNFY